MVREVRRLSDLLFVVVEKSVAGEMVVGVYTTLEAARAQLPPFESGRLGDFRVEAHELDADAPLMGWHVTISGDGAAEVTPVIQCSTCPPLEEGNAYALEDGTLHGVVWAITPGEALATARAEALALHGA
jgi:hypothetical protein